MEKTEKSARIKRAGGVFHRPVIKICLLEKVKDDEWSLTVEFHKWTDLLSLKTLS